ncbi:MAG TPA: MarR family transcriptional regulator [Candidatus Limnocylindrales bacterium]|nr:MarR family transcriptional regulator [Candidatus Limnocylindrales bacterium]
MRTIDPPTTLPASGATPSAAGEEAELPAVRPAAPTGPALIDAIVDELHGMIGSLRCAGTGRMVKAGISMTHLHILWVLEHHGDLTMSRLAEVLDVSLSNATGLVDRMAERGLVDRVRVPNDRRVVLVRASAEGSRIRDEIEAFKQDRIRSIIERLPADRLEPFLGAISDLRSAVVEEIGADHLTDHAHIHPHT